MTKDSSKAEVDDESGIRVRDPRGLLAAWSKAYRLIATSAAATSRCSRAPPSAKPSTALGVEAGNMAAYAAFSAAERQAPHVRQPKTWLYVDAQFLEMFARNAEAKEVDSGENIVVLIPNDSGVFLPFEADSMSENTRSAAPTPFRPTSISSMRGPGEEAAQALLDQKILPAWKSAARP